MSFKRHSESVTCWFSRLSFPHVWEPAPIMRQGRPVGEPRYSCLIILHDDIVERIRAIEAKLIAQSWPEWPMGEPPPGIILQTALKRGETVRSEDPNLAGKWVLSANAKKDSPPWVTTKDPATGLYLPVVDRSTIYGGCEAHVSVGLFTTQIKITEPQINVGLNGLQLTGRPFPSFENRISAEQAMKRGPDVAAPPVPAARADVAAPPIPPSGATVAAFVHSLEQNLPSEPVKSPPSEPVENDPIEPAYNSFDPMNW